MEFKKKKKRVEKTSKTFCGALINKKNVTCRLLQGSEFNIGKLIVDKYASFKKKNFENKMIFY